MENKLKEILLESKLVPETDLAENIWRRVLSRNKRTASLKLWVLSAVGLASFLGLIPAIKMLAIDFSQSGFYEYLSLIFSDGRSVLAHFNEFTLSLAESLPVLSILLSLSLVLILILSIRYAMKQIIRGQLSLSFGT